MLYGKQFPNGQGMNLTHGMRVRRVEADPAVGWTKHTLWHWSRDLNGKKIDFWPTKDKWLYDGKVMTGDVDKFIAKISKQSGDAG